MLLKRTLLLTFVLCCFAVQPSDSFADLPNVVLILADDMGPGEPSHAGGLIPTPAIDSLATDGMRFTDAHSNSSVCTPTRYGILTGRYCWRSRLKSGVLTSVDSQPLMDPKRLNLPAFMQKSGYHTACVGKWHLGLDWVKQDSGAATAKRKKRDFGSWNVDYTKEFSSGPLDVGFDEAFFIQSSLDMPPYIYLRDNKAVTVPTIEKGFPHNEYNDYQRVGACGEDFNPSDCLADWAAESRNVIQRSAADPSKKPFFLYLPLTSPHTPITPGERFKGRYKQYSWYADFVAETDWVVAEVLEQLKESGVDNNTMVIYTSDNGFAPYVKIPKMLAAGYKPSGAYRGSKASLYEGGHRVPFLVRWPGVVQPGSECDTTICTTDFFATLADIVGAKAEIPDDAAEDSFSFLQCLRGDNAPVRPFTIHHSISGKFAIRKGDWKLLLSKNGAGGWASEADKLVKTPAKLVQLYNMKEDSGETKNLEQTHPEKVTEFVNDLAKAIRDGRTRPGKKQSNEGWPYRDQPTSEAFSQLKQ